MKVKVLIGLPDDTGTADRVALLGHGYDPPIVVSVPRSRLGVSVDELCDAIRAELVRHAPTIARLRPAHE